MIFAPNARSAAASAGGRTAVSGGPPGAPPRVRGSGRGFAVGGKNASGSAGATHARRRGASLDDAKSFDAAESPRRSSPPSARARALFGSAARTVFAAASAAYRGFNTSDHGFATTPPPSSPFAPPPGRRGSLVGKREKYASGAYSSVFAACTTSLAYAGATASARSFSFHSPRAAPPPAASSGRHTSRRFELSSNVALTWTGRPVRTGRGRKQNARPLRPSKRGPGTDPDSDPSSPGAVSTAPSVVLRVGVGFGARAATLTHGTRPRFSPTSESASALTSPPASELHTIHRSATTTLRFSEGDDAWVFPSAPPVPTSWVPSFVGSSLGSRLVSSSRSIHPTLDGRFASGVDRSFARNAFRSAFPPPPSPPPTQRRTLRLGSAPPSNPEARASYSSSGLPLSDLRSYTPIFRTCFKNKSVSAARCLKAANSDRTASAVYASGLISDVFADASVLSGNRNMVASYRVFRSHPNTSAYGANWSGNCARRSPLAN